MNTIRRDDGSLLDHRPLGMGIAPWRKFFELLRGVGYDGTVNLEMVLHPFGDLDELCENVRYSIQETEAIFGGS